MSRPDYVICAFTTDAIPLEFEGFPHGLAVLPLGVAVKDVGGPSNRVGATFLIEPDCADVVLGDRAFWAYIEEKIPVVLFASRARDLRPFLRRAEVFRRRGMTIEAMP